MSRTGGRSATITCLCRPAISLRASIRWPSSASAAPRYLAASARMSEHKFIISKTRVHVRGPGFERPDHPWARSRPRWPPRPNTGDDRGALLPEFAAANELFVLNDPNSCLTYENSYAVRRLYCSLLLGGSELQEKCSPVVPGDRSPRPPWSRPGTGVIRALESRPTHVSCRTRSAGYAQIQRTVSQ
ncbi:hypothetical protein MRX96_044733 [Rhipicephalus microplus]